MRSVDVLLTESEAGRGKVQEAVNDTDQCRGPARAAATLRQMAAQRQDLADRARRLDTSATPQARALVALLVEAWSASGAAHLAFADWVESAEGCSGGSATPPPTAEKWRSVRQRP
jgi:hypothetical protein